MELRKSICDAIEMIDLDCSYHLKEKEKQAKITLWHMQLERVSDSSIEKGLKKELDSPSKDFPRIGYFKSLCSSRQASNATEDEKEYIPVGRKIAQANAKKILDKLLSMNKR